MNDRVTLRPADRLLIITEVGFCLYWLSSWGDADVVPIMVLVHLVAALLPFVIAWLAHGRGRLLAIGWQVYPMFFIGVHWSEAGLIHAQLHDKVYDAVVMGWDLSLFGVHLQEVWLPAMPYVWLSEIMLLMYFTYYPVVFGSPLPLIFQKRDDATEDLVFRLFLTYMACFVVYLFFPVEGPKMSMGRMSGPHEAGFFYRLIESLTEAGDSLGTAFPSSHVAGMAALAIAGYRWFGKKANAVITGLAIGMTVSTVYVQHHFAIDALAGVVLATVCALVAPPLKKALMRIRVPRASALLLPAALLLTGAGRLSAQTWEQTSSAKTEWIVFSSSRTGGGDIYAVQAVSGETILVAGSPLPESSVRYDSFRDRIVYDRYDDRRAMLVSGGRDLFADPSGDVSPTWSPDGWRIVYAADRGGREDLFIARTDGSREKQLTDDPEIDRYPAWSPDGSRIVFARRDEKGWDLFTLDLKEPAPMPEHLTEEGVYVGHPSWSLDGRYIAFDTVVDGQSEIAMLEIDTGETTRLTERDGDDLVPSWSLDGRRLSFGGQSDSTGNWDIWTVEVDSRNLRRLTTHSDFDGGPVVVPASALGRE